MEVWGGQVFVFEAGNCPGFGELFCPVMQLNYFFHATIAYFSSFLFICNLQAVLLHFTFCTCGKEKMHVMEQGDRQYTF